MSTNILALFAATPYVPPAYMADGDDVDLTAHLTNTSLQRDNPDAQSGVRLLSELVGCTICSGEPSQWEGQALTQENVDGLVDQVSKVLAETFKAAIASPIHFQVYHLIFSFPSKPLCCSTGPAQCLRNIWGRSPGDARTIG